MNRDNPSYAQVTNWTLVHELIRAALQAKAALAPEADATARNVAQVYLDKALMSVDEAHALNEKHRAAVAEFTDEQDRGDDTNGDGSCPMIGENEDYDEENYTAPAGVGGIWISHCSYVDLTKEKQD
jgi:hypothetical protein